jgi:hypothetical protein
MSALVLPTRVAKALWDEHVIYGKRLFAEIVPAGLARHIALVAAGRTLADQDVDLFSYVVACACIPDPHIWPLRAPRLAASFGRFTPGVAAGLLLMETDRLGNKTAVHVGEWLIALSANVGADFTDDDVARAAEALFRDGGRIPGFGVPFRDEDERVVAASRFVEQMGHAERRHWRLARAASACVKARHGLAPNYGVACAAILLDMGFAPRDIAPIMLLGIHLGQIPNAVEGAEQRADVLRSLPAEAISYEGPPPRRSPRARKT